MKNLTYKEMLKLMIIAFILILILFNVEHIFNLFRGLISILAPFIIGVSLAYVLNVPMKKIEKSFGNMKGKRTISLMIVLFITILMVATVINLVIPELYKNILEFASSLPELLVKYKYYLSSITDKYPAISDDIANIDVGSLKDTALNYGKSILVGSGKLITGLVGVVFNIFTGIIFAIYILLSKESILKRASIIGNEYLPSKIYNKIKYIVKVFDDNFNKFIGGQCLECLILGVMIYLALLILHIPYALTIAVLTTITAIIPIFGSFIAFGVGILLLVLTNPVKALMFAIAFLVIQQIEGNLIYPHVVGSSVGLSPLWTMLAVIVFGSIFGLLGMIIAVPLTSTILTLSINRTNRHKESS